MSDFSELLGIFLLYFYLKTVKQSYAFNLKLCIHNSKLQHC